MRKPHPLDWTDEQRPILAPMISIDTDGRPPVVVIPETVDAILRIYTTYFEHMRGMRR